MLLAAAKPIQAGIGVAVGVQCHPDHPEVCIGRTQFTTPPPVACRPPQWMAEAYPNGTYPNGSALVFPCPRENWISYDWIFVEGLTEEATANNMTYEELEMIIDNALTGFEIVACIDYDSNECKVVIDGNYDEPCISCAVCNSTFGSEALSVDCTNFENGATLECESLYPFLYPFVVDGETDPLPVDTDSETNGETNGETAASGALRNVPENLLAASFVGMAALLTF